MFCMMYMYTDILVNMALKFFRFSNDSLDEWKRWVYRDGETEG